MVKLFSRRNPLTRLLYEDGVLAVRVRNGTPEGGLWKMQARRNRLLRTIHLEHPPDDFKHYGGQTYREGPCVRFYPAP